MNLVYATRTKRGALGVGIAALATVRDEGVSRPQLLASVDLSTPLWSRSTSVWTR